MRAMRLRYGVFDPNRFSSLRSPWSLWSFFLREKKENRRGRGGRRESRAWALLPAVAAEEFGAGEDMGVHGLVEVGAG
jgi:hypothetical protein